MFFFRFSMVRSGLQRSLDLRLAVIARPLFRRECRRKLETDDDSFDIGNRWQRQTLKTKGMIERGFGILVALSQHRERIEKTRNKITCSA
jgi:hypothetical protein